jgi:putative transcriptional regulator
MIKFKLRAKSPPKTDWRAFDAMTEEERHAAALSDPDCLPATEMQLARARRVSAHLRMHAYRKPAR